MMNFSGPNNRSCVCVWASEKDVECIEFIQVYLLTVLGLGSSLTLLTNSALKFVKTLRNGEKLHFQLTEVYSGSVNNNCL